MPSYTLADAEALHARIVAAHAVYRRSERELALLLAELASGRLYKLLGFSSLRDYGSDVLHLRPRKVQGLAALGQRLADLPELDRAFAAGELSWSKAREVARVATDDTEAAWVEQARASTSRELEVLVSAASPGDAPDDALLKGPSRVRLVFEMDACEAEQVRLALAAIRAATSVSHHEVGDGAILAQMAQRVVHDLEVEHAPTGERFRTVLEHCPSCRLDTAIDDEVNDTHVGTACCDGEVMEMRPGPTRGHVTRVVAPATRRVVLHRDRYRCQVPGCSNWLWLDLHHLLARHAGGTHAEWNLLTLCCTHHRMVHDGLLAITRQADGSIRFEFPDGRVTERPPIAAPRRSGTLTRPAAAAAGPRGPAGPRTRSSPPPRSRGASP